MEEHKEETPLENEVENVILPDTESKNKITEYILKHKAVFSLIALILILFTWATIRMNIMENRFEKEKESINFAHLQQIDSMNITHIETLSKILAWTVRDEHLLRNTKKINQLFLNYSYLVNTKNISLINSENNKVLISTDKSFEGTVFPNIPIQIPNQVTLSEESFIRILSPLFDLNNKLTGILVIDYQK